MIPMIIMGLVGLGVGLGTAWIWGRLTRHGISDQELLLLLRRDSGEGGRP